MHIQHLAGKRLDLRVELLGGLCADSLFSKLPPPNCSHEGCVHPTYAKGLCRNCYRRNHRKILKETARAGNTIPVDTYDQLCAVRDCMQRLCDQGMCVTHLSELLRAATKRGRIFSDAPDDLCAVRECERPPGARGVCVPHRALFDDLADRLPSGLNASGPEVEFEMRRTSLDEIDLGDNTLEMRIDYKGIPEMAASIARWGIIQNVILWQPPGKERFVVVAGNARCPAPRQGVCVRPR